MVAAVGVRETVTGAVIVMLATACLLGSAPLVAVTVTVCWLLSAAGAVYRPALEIVPTAGFTDQVTAIFVVPVTAAVNCCVCPAERLAVAGDTLTVIGAATEISKSEIACVPAASRTCTVNLYGPCADGVPSRVPPVASVIPGGKLPANIDQV
jgi:hypothetical protein